MENKGFVETDKVLRLFSENPSHARRLYEDFINEAIGLGRDESLYKVVDQQILGNDRFVEKVEKKVEKLNKPLRRPSSNKGLSSIIILSCSNGQVNGPSLRVSARLSC